MFITANTLPEMATANGFVANYTTFVIDAMKAARLYPRFSIQRLVEAQGAWQNDLSRVGAHEPNLEDGLDHFKQCGHLAFWIRRMSPLIEAADLTQNAADPPGYDVSEGEQEFRNLLFAYANEYLAFDLGFQICKYYESNKAGAPEASARAKALVLDHDYYKTMCHFLKYKTVSPHAMFLIYKSLFAV